MMALNRLPESHHRVDCIFWSFGFIVLHLSCFEYIVLLKDLLEPMSRTDSLNQVWYFLSYVSSLLPNDRLLSSPEPKAHKVS